MTAPPMHPKIYHITHVSNLAGIVAEGKLVSDATMMARGGQEPIVHLEADLHAVIRWAEQNGRRWAFSLSNAGAYYTEFRAKVDELKELDWNAIGATNFRQPEVKERKQAEFLIYGSFPLELIGRIGVRSQQVQRRATEALAGTGYRPPIEAIRQWYY